MSTAVIGHSSLKTPLLSHVFEGTQNPGPRRNVLVLGGVHGDEPEGVLCAMGLIERFTKGLQFSFTTHIIPIFNPDGVLACKRVNGQGVDLNRNLPTQDWNPQAFNERYPPGPHAGSEPENQALVKWLDEHKPIFVLSLHSFSRTLINTNGSCEAPASAMHKISGYPIEPSIGYPTPGCLGTYAGLERPMPTITYEMLRGMPPHEIYTTHVEACVAALKTFDHPPQ